jgi:hypothetical protein
MSLWTLLQSILLVANALAILNEERFLEPKNLSQSAITSGYVSSHGFKGQLIGLIYAASYLRSALSFFLYLFLYFFVVLPSRSLVLMLSLLLFSFACITLQCLSSPPTPW